MHFQSLLAAVSLLRIVSAGIPTIEKRVQHSCNRDNLLRNLVDPRHSAAASVYCSSLVPAPYPTYTTTVKTSTSTSYSTIDQYTTTATTTTASTTTTTTYTATTNTPPPENRFFLEKRQATPTFLPTTYPASRVSSACSCVLGTTSSSFLATITTTATTTEQTSLTTATTTTTATVSALAYCDVPGCSTSNSISYSTTPTTWQACMALCNSTPGCDLINFSTTNPFDVGGSSGYYCGLFAGSLESNYYYSSSSYPECAAYQFYENECT